MLALCVAGRVIGFGFPSSLTTNFPGRVFEGTTCKLGPFLPLAILSSRDKIGRAGRETGLFRETRHPQECLGGSPGIRIISALVIPSQSRPKSFLYAGF